MEPDVIHSTGQVRRISDMGQIVIPKEVRNILSMKEGETLECFIFGDAVCFKKYIPESAVHKASAEYKKELAKCTPGLTTDQSFRIQKLIEQLDKIVEETE